MKEKISLIIIASILILSSIFAGISSAQINIKIDTLNGKSTSSWTIMVYICGDNNLEPYGIDDFLEMSAVGSNSDVNIIVQFDRSPYYDTRYGDWTSTKRYRVLEGMTPTAANAISDIGEANMGDPQTVINFGNWAISNYPANNYCFIFWDHGSGWKQGNTGLRKYVCADDTDMDALETDELRTALNSITSGGANKIDLLGFDACLMGMVEIGYEIKNYCGYMTASEQTEPAAGWEYESTLNALENNPSMSAESLGEKFVDYYNGDDITLSTVNLGSYSYFRSQISDLAAILRNNAYRDEIEYAIQNVQSYDDYDYIDLYHFAQIIENKINNNDVKNKALAVMYGVNNVVTSEKHDSGNPNSHGISIYFPYYSYDENYQYLLFSEDSEWDNLIEWYYDTSGSDPPTNPIITGPYNGTTGTDYTYTFVSTDPDGDEISYYVEWGDTSAGESSELLSSGEAWETSHTWYSDGAYIIKAKATDSNGAESGWSYLTVTMPRYKSTNLRSIIINNFPILKLILKYLDVHQFLI